MEKPKTLSQLLAQTDIPYYGIELTPEQFKKVEGKNMTFYDIDGQTFFEMKNDKGDVVSHVAYVTWK